MGDDAESGPQIVKLISSDGYEFIVERDAAMVSGTIKNMLSSPGSPALAPFFTTVSLSRACCRGSSLRTRCYIGDSAQWEPRVTTGWGRHGNPKIDPNSRRYVCGVLGRDQFSGD